jgi:4-hydroxy-3-methylbut-2-enyl diphosphate reductase
VRSILSFAPERARAVSSAASVGELPEAECVGVVAQTTLAAATFRAVVSRCERRYGRVRAIDTICNATAVRQREATALAAEVAAMVVVGGRESANTRRLVELCRAIRPEATFHVESADELPRAELAACPVVGVTAGASTPEWVIAEVVARLRELG